MNNKGFRLSFDLWGTLIKGNPEFKKAKNEWVRHCSNSNTIKNLHDSEIEAYIKRIKTRNDDIIETYGTMPAELHVFGEMALVFSIPPDWLDEFYNGYQNLFINHLPLLYSEDTLEILRRLKSDGHTLYISSNTLFTSCIAMREMVWMLNLGELFNVMKFSGEECLSKPSGEMFFNSDYHIGDNIKTDGACVNHGIKFFQINSNDKTIVDFYNHIKQYEKVLIA